MSRSIQSSFKMVSRTYSLAAILVLATVTVGLAHASSQTQISLTSTGATEIDLAWDHKDRMIKTWTEFSNFNPSDGSFSVQVIQTETGKIVYNTTPQVMTNSEKSSINFNSFVLYLVNAEDICQNEDYDPSTSSWQECSPLTGEYEMQISTNDGSVSESVPFSIVDSRV